MDLKVNKQWLDAVTLTRDLADVIVAAGKVLEKGHKVCILAIDSVEVDDNKVELVTVEIES